MSFKDILKSNNKDKLLLLRRISSTNGSYVQWKSKNNGWNKKYIMAEGLTDLEVIKLFQDKGWDIKDTIIEWGDYTQCSLCKKSSDKTFSIFYSDKHCRKCWSKDHKTWKIIIWN